MQVRVPILAFGAALLMALSASPALAVELRTEPGQATVFQKVRGKYHFVGYSPLKLTPEKLQGKTFAELLVLHYAHTPKHQKVDILTTPSPTTIVLTPNQPDPAQTLSECEAGIVSSLKKHFADTPIPLKLGTGPVVATDQGSKRFLFLGMQIIHYDDLYAIRRSKRHQQGKM